MSETDLKRSIAKSLRSCGCIVVRIQAGGVRVGGHYVAGAGTGTPDLVVLDRDGKTTWLEVKTNEGERSKGQVEWHKRAASMGHRVTVVRSVSEAVKAVTHG